MPAYPAPGYCYPPQTQTTDLAPGLTHSAMSTQSGGMDIDSSRSMDDHRARIPYSHNPVPDQLQQQRLYQQQLHLGQHPINHNNNNNNNHQHLPINYQLASSFSSHAHQHHHTPAASPTQLQRLDQQRYYQQQQQEHQQQEHQRRPPFEMSPQVPFQQQHQHHQAQGQHPASPPHAQMYGQLYPTQPNQTQLAWQDTVHSMSSSGMEQQHTVGTEMPSLAYSDGNSTATQLLNQTKTSPQGQAGREQRQAFPSPSPSISPQHGQQPAVDSAGSIDTVDNDYFLTSVLNMIAPTGGLPPVMLYDYLAEFPQRQQLARGGNGLVKRAFWPRHQTYVILKNLISTKNSPEKIAKLFDKEVEVMNRCRQHDNIVRFYGVAVRTCDDERNGERSMVMQYYEHGDLVKLMEVPQDSPEAPTLTDKLYLALDIAMGLDHLFRCGFHHGDLHPKNILIDIRRDRTPQQGRYVAKLTDFGLRRIRGSMNAFSSQQFGGVWQFMAPERMVTQNRPRYDVRCDIFALGVIYWFIMAGRYPFKDPSAFSLGVREGRIEGTPDWYYDVYTKAWTEDPNARQQSLDEIVQVFRYNLGIRTPPIQHLDSTHVHSHPHHSPTSLLVYGYDSATYSAYPSYDPHHNNNSQFQPYHYTGSSVGGSTIRGSPMITPASMLTPTSLNNGHASPHPPSPLFDHSVAAGLSSSSSTSSTARSNNPNHPRYRQVAVPNGKPTSIYR